MRKLLQIVAAVVVATHTYLSLAAPPSKDDPQASFSTRPQGLTEQLALETLRLNSQILEEVQRYEDNLSQGRYKQAVAAEMKRISGTYVKVREHQRMARQLTELREPAGIDMQLRNVSLDGRIQEVIRLYKDVPGAGPLIGKAEPATRSLAATKAKLLEPLQKPLDQGKHETVEGRFYNLWDEVEQSIVWQGGQLPILLRGPFIQFERQLLPLLAEAHQVQAVELINQLRAAQTPPFTRFLENVDASVTSVGETGAATWGGQQRQGPELITAWMVGWRQAHVMSLRAQALTQSLPEETKLDPPDTLATDYADFHARMISACAALVAADAARVDDAHVPDLYARYLAAFAAAIPRMSDDSLRSAIGPELTKLRNKSPEFTQRVDAYERATSHTLQWRQRKAEAWRRRYEATSPALEKLLAQAADQNAMVARGGKDSKIDRLFTAAPALVRDVGLITADKTAMAAALSPDDKTPVCKGRLKVYFFGEAAKVQVPPAEIDDLKADLLISPAAPALTLDAAIAVVTAEQGFFAAIGGSVNSVEVDSRLGRIINLEDDAILPAGSLLGERSDEPLKDLIWRITLTPTWAQHTQFFILSP